MKRLATFAVAAGSLGITACSQPPQTRDTPAAIVTQLYEDYAWEVVTTSSARNTLMDEPIAVLSKYFDDNLAQLIARDHECRVRTKEVCKLNGSPIWQSNDPEAFDLSVATNDSTSATVSFRRRYPQPIDTMVNVRYRMTRTPQGWRVVDILSDDGESLVQMLSAKSG